MMKIEKDIKTTKERHEKWLNYTLKKEDRLKANKFNESLKDILKTNPVTFYRKIKNLFSTTNSGGLPKFLEYKEKTYIGSEVLNGF